jgi:hypothetical protein
MKKSLPSFIACAALAVLSFNTASAQTTAATPAATPAAPKYDFGDFTSSTLTTKAWKATEAKDYAAVAAYTGKCIEMFKGKAVEMQKALTAPPVTDDKEKVFANWALNDVGTCYYILGQSLEKQGKAKEAVEAYKFLSENLSYTRCYDTKGWFWNPADAAKERVKALEFDSLK